MHTRNMNRMMIRGAAILLMLYPQVLGMHSNRFPFKALLDTNKILIGDHQVAMRIFVTHSKHIKFSFLHTKTV